MDFTDAQLQAQGLAAGLTVAGALLAVAARAREVEAREPAAPGPEED